MKQIEGYENYSVMEDGKVWSNNSKSFLIPFSTKAGYMQVGLNSNGAKRNHYVHRLVAQAYIPNIENKPEVNHLNKDKSNNSVSNLEWSTKKENVQHSWINRSSHRKGKNLSDEHKLKLKESRKGQKRLPHSEEAKRKISESQKARQKKPV